MKKLFISALLAMSLISSAFASDVKKVNSNVSDAFTAQFAGVKDVEWVTKPDFMKASFTFNGKKTDAFYKYNGELIGSSSAITVDELPTAAKRSFTKKYAAYTVKEAIKFDTDVDTAYYLTAENEKETLIIEVKDNSLSIFKRTARN